MAKPPKGRESPRLGQPVRPGVLYYLVGAALTAALISAAPVFWAPPVWLAALMARKPVDGRRGEPAGAAEPAAPARPCAPPGPPANEIRAAPPRSASLHRGGTGRA